MTASYRLRRKLGGQNCCLPPDRCDTTTRESVGDPSALQQFPIRWWSPDLPQPDRRGAGILPELAGLASRKFGPCSSDP